MWGRIGRLFIIKNRFEAMAVIYALGLGAVDRGLRYLEIYPGFGGWLLFAACTGAVFMAGAQAARADPQGQQASPPQDGLSAPAPIVGNFRQSTAPAKFPPTTPNRRKWRISAKKLVWHGSC